jgi:hypothetical protein
MKSKTSSDLPDSFVVSFQNFFDQEIASLLLKLYDSFWNTLILSYQEFEGWL